MLDEDNVNSGAKHKEMELDYTIQMLDKNQPKQALNTSLVSQNNGNEHLDPDKAEKPAGFEMDRINANIQEKEHLDPNQAVHEEQSCRNMGTVNAEFHKKDHLVPNQATHEEQAGYDMDAVNAGIQEKEHLDPNKAAHEEPAGLDVDAVNAEIKEIFTDIKVRKLAKKEAAAVKSL